jgi:organic radical activating enzyme
MALPSLSSLFAPKAPQAPAAPQPQQPTGVPGSTLQQPNPNSGDPQPPAPSPLEQYKDLWKTNDTQGQQPADPFAAPLFNTDMNKLRDAVQKTDFTAGVPQDVMQKVMQGGDPQSLMALINHVAQQSLSMSLQLNTTLQEQAGQTLGKRFSEAIPTKISEYQLKNQAPTNPILSNPAAEPMLQMARNQFRMQHPDKSPMEINQLAEQYLTDFATSLAGGKGPTSGDSNEQKQGQDWAQWGGVAT